MDGYGHVLEHVEDADKVDGRQEEDDEDDWIMDENSGMWTCRDPKTLAKTNADASFPGLLSLGDVETSRLGYLSYLSGLSKSRELRGHDQATTSETSKTFGKEVEWMMEHWPQLKVVELLSAESSTPCASHFALLQKKIVPVFVF